jgi:hypothetical protein
MKKAEEMYRKNQVTTSYSSDFSYRATELKP